MSVRQGNGMTIGTHGYWEPLTGGPILAQVADYVSLMTNGYWEHYFGLPATAVPGASNRYSVLASDPISTATTGPYSVRRS